MNKQVFGFKNQFKGILIGVVMSLLLSVSVSAIASTNNQSSKLLQAYYTISSIKVDNKAMQLTEKPFIHQGRTYVPLRAVSENLGCDVAWNNSTKSIDIYKDTVKPIAIPTPTLKPKPSPTEVVSDYVYITSTGTKYHKKGCSYLNKSCIKVKLADVKKYYTPCSACFKWCDKIVCCFVTPVH